MIEFFSVLIHEPQVLIEGVLFRARYLGSTQLVCEGQPTKATRMMQAEEAVSRIKVCSFLSDCLFISQIKSQNNLLINTLEKFVKFNAFKFEF
jgi:hypothetical protein